MTDTPPYRTKLIEVGLPLVAINVASAREKNIRHGHPSTLHLYWARRPLAACRAVLFSSLVDDPSSDPLYKDKSEEEIQVRRQEIHDLLAELVLWESTTNEKVINRARAEIASSLASFASEKGEIDSEDWPGVIERTAKPKLVNKYLAEVAPPVLDPFAGGGSIPLEAQRLGLRVYASDLNPLAVLINKALIEIPPKFSGQPPINPEAQSEDGGMKTWKGAAGLAEDVRYYGQWLRDEAENRIGNLYPKITVTSEMVAERTDLEKYEGQELTTIAWIWARVIPSPNPSANGANIPLVRSFWLSKKKGAEAFIEPEVCKSNKFKFIVKTGLPKQGFNPHEGTVSRSGSRCLLSNSPVTFDYIREQGKSGFMKNNMMAIIAEGNRSRVYLSPIASHMNIATVDRPENCPDAILPLNPRNFNTPNYGLTTFADLFTNRQLNTLCVFSDLIHEVHKQVVRENPDKTEEYANAVVLYLAFAIDQMMNRGSTIATWDSSRSSIRSAFGRQALPMTWDFAETNPFSDSSGGFMQQLSSIVRYLETQTIASAFGIALQHDATIPYDFVDLPVISTDPPYYDNIGYADLSDFFYIWLHKSLGKCIPRYFKTLQTPKKDELIATPYRHRGDKNAAKDFFEIGLGKSIYTIRSSTDESIPVTIYYAYKQTETDNDGTTSTGWETFLSGLMKANYQISSTWPIRTEMANKIGMGNNMLASSVVLSCRPRPINAEVRTRTEFVKELRKSLGESLILLQKSSIAPVDLQQASIGPGMAVFSRYEKVLENDGTAMTVRSALGLINQVLDEVLVEQEGEFDADTRFAVVWFEQFAFENGEYGTAQVLATSKGISPEGVSEAGILKVGGGKCRLLSIDELEPNWNPETDSRRTVWEVTHYLCKALEADGVEAAAKLVSLTFADADAARDLAYRLFSICEKKKMSTEAQPYNALVASWADILKVVSNLPSIEQREEVSTLFDE